MANMKVLNVCLAKDLPLFNERTPDNMYFLYDKLELYIGQTRYYNPFAIVETIPDTPIQGMLYLVLDGFVRIYTNYSVVEIAEINSDDELELLKQSGTAFFTNSEKRYLDLRRRLITLPYQNGTYELTLSLANSLKIDEDTVIGFNTETNQFEIIGNKEDYDLVFAKCYRGKESKTADIEVSDGYISGKVKVSHAYDNMLRYINDGLYACADDKMTKREFESWIENFRKYKTEMESYLREAKKKFESGTSSPTTEASITAKIIEALNNAYPGIEQALNEYESLDKDLSKMESRCNAYTDEKFKEAFDDIVEMLNTKFGQLAWGEI